MEQKKIRVSRFIVTVHHESATRTDPRFRSRPTGL